jgi:hypothetical protein
MDLETYIGDNEFGLQPPAERGVETDWLPLLELDVPSGRLWMGDPCMLHAEDGCCIDVPPGRYAVEAKCLDFGGDKFISRLRAYPCGTAVSVGDEVGETGTDSAAIGVADIVEAEAALAGQGDDVYERLDEQVSGRCGIVRLDQGVDVPYVNSGIGDGSGPPLRRWPTSRLRTRVPAGGFRVSNDDQMK